MLNKKILKKIFVMLGHENLDLFSFFWLRSYLLALLFALIISPLITIFIKPKMAVYLAK